MNTVDVLRQAKELLSDPARWNQRGGFARDAQGRTGPGSGVRPEGDSGVAWCALGSLRHVLADGRFFAHGWDFHPATQALIASVPATAPHAWSWSAVSEWNDLPSTTHADLIDAFDRAILSLAPATAPELVEVS